MLQYAPIGEEPEPAAVEAVGRLEELLCDVDLDDGLREQVTGIIVRVRAGGNSLVRMEVAAAANESGKAIAALADGVEFRVPRELADGDVWELVRPMWFALKTPYEADERLAQATPGQRALYGVQWAIAEIENGGFYQYFRSAVGRLAGEAVRGAKRIGATEMERLLREAGSRFSPPGPAAGEGERWTQIDSLPEDVFDDLDQPFYDLLDAVDHEELMRSYVDAHPEEFFLD